MIEEESRTIINSKGEILLFGINDFILKIAKGNCCFICGALPDSKKFNGEHVIPDWILRKYQLHNQKITLPNGTKLNYSQYKVPCCEDCNSELGTKVEIPISNLLKKSYESIVDEVKSNPKLIHGLFQWLCLIFLKTHLKDKTLPLDRARKDLGNIGDYHFWEEMHHIHCIARSHYTKAKIDNEVYGSIFILPVLKELGLFDYIDSLAGKTIMIQLDEFCIIAVLNDARAGYSIFKETIHKVRGILSPFQIREIIAHLNYFNINLKERPSFHSFLTYEGKYEIKANVPERWYLKNKEDCLVSPGEFLHFYVHDMIGEFEGKEAVLEDIRNGKRNYLFDEDGNFINHDVK